MPKQNKQKHLTPNEVADTMVEEKEQGIDKTCAAEVEEVLKRHNRGLQPFIERSEFGSQARVRLARLPVQESTDVEEV